MLYLLTIVIFIGINTINAVNSSYLRGDCKYVSVSLTTQIKIKNQNPSNKYVMDDMYKRFAKKYHMSSNQFKNCLDNKYKK